MGGVRQPPGGRSSSFPLSDGSSVPQGLPNYSRSSSEQAVHNRAPRDVRAPPSRTEFQGSGIRQQFTSSEYPADYQSQNRSNDQSQNVASSKPPPGGYSSLSFSADTQQAPTQSS